MAKDSKNPINKHKMDKVQKTNVATNKIIKNPNKKSVLFLLAGIFAIVLLVGISFFLSNYNDNEQLNKVNIYFLNNTTKKLEPVERYIPKEDETKTVEAVIRELKIGPSSTALSKAIPDTVLIEEIKLPKNSQLAEVQFSESYKDMSANEELFCRAALVWTLTELDFIKDVHIYIGNEELLKTNDEPMGLLNRSNVLIDSDIPANIMKQVTLKIYFADEQGLGLIPEERTIEVPSGQTNEKYIVEQIIKGPESPDLLATVPKETEIYSIRTDESVCYVDLSSEFIDKFVGGSTAERLAVYSIVNSLTESPNIKKVQFSVEGNKVSSIAGHLMDISAPIERDESIILD